MKKLMWAVLALVLMGIASPSMAATDPTFEVGYSSFATKGVVCSTGTITQINATRPTGFSANIAGYRIQNQDSSNAVWLGGVSVSSATTTAALRANLGEKLNADASVAWALGKDYSRATVPTVPLYCLAADAATSGVNLSLVWFGY